MFFFVLVLLYVGVTLAQEDPWPPLVTTCDVMPLIAADANKNAHDLMACSSSSRPTCEDINCDILTNNDQLELELLPCWQLPAMWIKNRKLNGTILYQDIFDSSRVSSINIGGGKVKLYVTVVQRNGLTLGFGVVATMPLDHANISVFLYRDIPLNLTECPTGIPLDYPLMCKMILYMEQYIITSISSTRNDPVMAAMCDRPHSGSCDTMHCSWKSPMGTTISHTYKFFRCSKPQSVGFELEVGEHFYSMTFKHSKVVNLNLTTTLNFTLLHPSDTTIGIEVSFINSGITSTIIPYTVLPMDTNGCPPLQNPKDSKVMSRSKARKSPMVSKHLS